MGWDDRGRAPTAQAPQPQKCPAAGCIVRGSGGSAGIYPNPGNRSDVMAAVSAVPRTRGGISGMLLILLGAWGAIIAFVGPYFGYAYTPDTTRADTPVRRALHVLPRAAALLGGG